MDIDRTKYIKMLIYQCKALKSTVERTLNDTATMENGRFASFKIYASQFNGLAEILLVNILLNAIPSLGIKHVIKINIMKKYI